MIIKTNFVIMKLIFFSKKTLDLTSAKPNDDENQRLLSMKKSPRKQTDPQEPLSSLTNDIFRFNGPRCWTEFRLNRSEIVRCLHE